MIIKSMVPLFSSNKVTKVFIKVITARSPSELGAMQGKNAPDPIFSQRINDMEIGINITKVDYLHFVLLFELQASNEKAHKKQFIWMDTRVAHVYGCTKVCFNIRLLNYWCIYPCIGAVTHKSLNYL